VFVSKKRWDLIVTDIYELQDDMFILELYIKRLIDKDNKENAKERHPSSPKKTTTKKVEKNGK
jgi:hypothetical protein